MLQQDCCVNEVSEGVLAGGFVPLKKEDSWYLLLEFHVSSFNVNVMVLQTS